MAELMEVVLNDGHLEKDDRGFLGKETEGGNNKKTVALIKKYLEEYDVIVRVVSQDDGTPFEKLGYKYPNATLFYSHHTNSGGGRGTEVFYHYGRTLAQNIAQRTAKILNTVVREQVKGDKGAKKNSNQFGGAGYAVINQARKAGVKYQLMGEIGFHDNEKEVKLIVSERDKIAFAIADEIAKYLKLEKKVDKNKPKEDELDVAQNWAVNNGIMRDMMWDEPITRHQMAWWLFDLEKKRRLGQLK